MYPRYSIASYHPKWDNHQFSPSRTWRVMALTDPWWGDRSPQSQPWSSSTGFLVRGDQVCESNRAVAWPAGFLAWPGLPRRAEKLIYSSEVLDQATCPYWGHSNPRRKWRRHQGAFILSSSELPSALCLGGRQVRQHSLGQTASKRYAHEFAKCAAPAIHCLTSLRGHGCPTFPHLNQKGEKCGICVMEKTGKCIRKMMDSGVSEKLLPASALWLWILVWL